MAHVARVAATQGVRLPQFRLSSLSPGCHRDLARRQRTLSFRASEVQAQVASGRFWRGRLEASGPASRRLRLAVEAATLLPLIAADASRSPATQGQLKSCAAHPSVWHRTLHRFSGKNGNRDGTGGPRNESNMASGSSPQSPTGRKPFEG